MAMGGYKIIQENEEVSKIHGTVSELASSEYCFPTSNLICMSVGIVS